jgi:rod shape-determining protein MreB
MARRIGIDLGTTNVLVYVPGKGIVINEPCVVALETSSNKVMAIGEEAKQMLGRTPDSIIAAHPLRDGAIASYKITEAMLRYFINKVSGRIRIFKPEIMVAIPAGVTSTEKRAVIDACIQAGAKQAFTIKEPVAAALGAGIAIAAASGNMVIDIGGGTSEVAVISLGDIVASSSVRVGGVKIDMGIANYIRKKHNLAIGEQTAEQIKIKIGTAMPLKKELSMEVSGCNTITGLPESVIITSTDIVTAIKGELGEIINAVKSVLQKTPPELASDIIDNGIIMTGGTSQLRHLTDLVYRKTGVKAVLADDSLFCVAKGTGVALEHLEVYKKAIMSKK